MPTYGSIYWDDSSPLIWTRIPPDKRKGSDKMPMPPSGVTTPPSGTYYKAMTVFDGGYYSPQVVSNKIYTRPVARLYKDRDEAAKALMDYIKEHYASSLGENAKMEIIEKEGVIFLAPKVSEVVLVGTSIHGFGFGYYDVCRNGKPKAYEFHSTKAKIAYDNLMVPLQREQERINLERDAFKKQRLAEVDKYLFEYISNKATARGVWRG
jgi:hypothetical protein